MLFEARGPSQDHACPVDNHTQRPSQIGSSLQYLPSKSASYCRKLVKNEFLVFKEHALLTPC